MADRNPENGQIICDYIDSELVERNIADTTREWKLKVLTWLSAYFKHERAYRSLEEQDILV